MNRFFCLVGAVFLVGCGSGSSGAAGSNAGVASRADCPAELPGRLSPCPAGALVDYFCGYGVPATGSTRDMLIPEVAPGWTLSHVCWCRNAARGGQYDAWECH